MPEGLNIVMCRFFCAVFLHITLTDEYRQAFELQKYAINHPWKFESWIRAFRVGFMQMFITLAVETTNLGILLTNSTIIDTIKDFIALVIISDFDDYFFLTVKNDSLGNLIS